MDADLKREWIEALRSGDYQQGKKWLRDRDDHYCCLGVLLDLVAPSGWIEQQVGYEYLHGDDLRCSFLPSAIADEVGLDFVVQQQLANMNDAGATFDQIADYIGQEL